MGGGNKVVGERHVHVLVHLPMVHVEDLVLSTKHEVRKSVLTQPTLQAHVTTLKHV